MSTIWSRSHISLGLTVKPPVIQLMAQVYSPLRVAPHSPCSTNLFLDNTRTKPEDKSSKYLSSNNNATPDADNSERRAEQVKPWTECSEINYTHLVFVVIGAKIDVRTNLCVHVYLSISDGCASLMKCREVLGIRLVVIAVKSHLRWRSLVTA